MKNIWLFLLLLITTAARSQVFEGTITWSIKYDITDPAKKAEMEKHQKEMSDPANQEKMKKMQEQMNTPEMKAMMDANPQMKAQMEAATKMMQGGTTGVGQPATLIVKMKDKNALTKMDGGMMQMEILYRQDKDQSYMLDRNAKTFSVVQANSAGVQKKDSMQRKVVKTGETMKILGYTCTKYIVEITAERGAAMNQVFWTTTEIKGLDMKSLAKQRMGNSNQSMYYEGLTGIPLRTEMNTGQMNMVMEVTDIKRETLPAADFTIPADFKETKGMGYSPKQ